MGLYPVLIIPPIPNKQSLADYAVRGQSKAKEDATVIARRKRLLEDFLRRLVRHPILGGEHVLHRFLEDGVSWVSLASFSCLSCYHGVKTYGMNHRLKSSMLLLFPYCPRTHYAHHRITQHSKQNLSPPHHSAPQPSKSHHLHPTSLIISYLHLHLIIPSNTQIRASLIPRRSPKSSKHILAGRWRR